MAHNIPGGLYRTPSGSYVNANGEPVTKKDAEAAIKAAEKAEA